MKKHYAYLFWGMLTLVGLYLSSLYNYLLFHSIAELFSIIIACGIFMIAWNSRQFIHNNYLLFIGVAYLFVGGLDLVHTLGYKGLAIFKGYETNLATQLWIAARYTESLSLLIAPLFFRRRLRTGLILLGYSALFVLLLLSIFYWEIFPVCFVEGTGLTPFKKISEYVISFILLASIGLLFKNRQEFDRTVLRWVIGSIVLTVVSELCFTFYIHAYGLSNLIGHYFKILSFYFIYKAIIETGLAKPYDLLFRDIKRSEERYHSLFTHMINGFAHHKVLFDENGKPVDYVFLEVNDAFETLTGLKRENLIGKKVTEALPGVKNESADWIGTYGRVAMTGKAIRFESYSAALEKWYSVLAFSSEKDYFVTVFEDVTGRKRAEEELRQRTSELQQLTGVLEQRVQERTADLGKANEALRHLSSKLLSAHEDERKRIAGEIHDIIGACLNAVKFKVEGALQRSDEDPSFLTESLRVIVPVIREGVEECRRMQMDLRPSMLDDLGLLPTLAWFCRRFQTIYSGIEIEQKIGIEEDKIPNALKIAVYRVVQEAMNNIAKHSQADLVRLSFREVGDRMELVLQDNGQGFDVEKAGSKEATKKGLGLTSMRERTELSGGSFGIESAKGKGTVIRASWPI